jgi:quercetin dioxygenase-like cupin family protein
MQATRTPMSKPTPAEGSTPQDLAAIATEIRSESAYQRGGHGARTILREGDLRVVVLAMKAGAVVPEHQAQATASLHVISGRIRLTFAERSVELSPGQLVAIERAARHAVEALEESSFVLTLGA